MKLRRLPAQLLPTAAVILILLGTWHLLGRMTEEVGSVALAGPVVIRDSGRTGAAGQASIELGAPILGQDAERTASANARHLRIERDPQGAWWISNLAADRRVALETPEGVYPDLRRWTLRVGDRIRIGECTLLVDDIRPREARIRQTCLDGAERHALWQIKPEPLTGRAVGHLSFEGEQTRPADEPRRTPVLLLGGRGSEPIRWPLESIEPESLRLVWERDEFVLSLNRFAIVSLQRQDGKETSFHEQSVLLMPAASDGRERRLVVGRTVYAITVADGALMLTPTARRHAFRGQELDGLSCRRLDPSGLTADRCGREERRWFIGGSESRHFAFAVASGSTWLIAALIGGTLALSPVVLATLSRVWVLPAPGLVPPAGRWARLAIAQWEATARLVQRPAKLVLSLLALGMTLTVVITLAIQAGEAADRLAVAQLTLVALGTSSLLLLLGNRLRGHAGRLWVLALALGCAGLIAQAQLAFGANSSRWLDRVDSNLLGLARIAAAVALLASLRIEPLLAWVACLVRQAGWGWGALRFALPLLALLLSAWEFLRGGIIAAEAAKIAFVLTLAIALAGTSLALAGPAPWRALRSQLPMIAATASLPVLFAVVPILQSDFSPLLIMLLASAAQLVLAGLLMLTQSFASDRTGPDPERRRRLLGGSFVLAAALLAAGPVLMLPWTLQLLLVAALLIGLHSLVTLLRLRLRLPLWRRAPLPGRRPATSMPGPVVDRVLARGLLALGLSAFLTLAWGFEWTRADPGRLDGISAKLADRFRVWQDPWHHPDAAFQLLSGFERIRRAPASFDEVQLGQNPAGLQLVPRIEDDLIGAFLLARFGTGPTLLVMVLQILLVAQAYASGLMAWRSRPGDGADRAARQGLALAAMGVGTLWLLQALLPWCNALGLLPLMGQSMTWLAYGQSHLLAVGGGGLVVGLLTSFAADNVGTSRLAPWPNARPVWLPSFRGPRLHTAQSP